MTRYLRITPLQEPFDLGLDDNQRPMVGFNILCEKVESDTFLEEVVRILELAGVGLRGTTIFTTSKSGLPTSGEGPWLKIRETGGLPGRRIQNQTAPAYPRPAAQVVAVAAGAPDTAYARARTMARAAYVALVAIKNTDVSP
jgi:hypothetical protein